MSTTLTQKEKENLDKWRAWGNKMKFLREILEEVKEKKEKRENALGWHETC